MTPDYQPKTIYYRAKDDAQIENLPFFFGWVEFDQGKISGRHYKPKLDQFTNKHTIGYYKIQGDESDFLHTFETKGLVEITQEDFNALLSKWTKGGEYTPENWGTGLTWDIAKPD